MESEGVDYSSARPGGAVLRNAGKSFAVRYLGSDGRCLTHSERDDLLANNVAIATVFEWDTGDYKGGFEAGKNNANFALWWHQYLGIAQDRPIYFAIDQSVPTSELHLMDQYFQGIQSVLPLSRIGVYGGYYTLQRAELMGYGTYYWQALAWSTDFNVRPPRFLHFPARHMFQWGGGDLNGSVDFNTAYGEDFGQWPLGDEGLSQAQYDELKSEIQKLTTSVYSGAEEKDVPMEQRYNNALYRRDETLEGRLGSVSDRASSAMALAMKAGGAGAIAGSVLTVLVQKVT